MSQVGPVSRDLFLDAFLHERSPEALEVPGMTELTESSPDSDNRDSVAMRLAFIGDEMEVRWMLPHIAELPGVAVYSLAFTYNQTGLRGVFRSFMDGLTNLRENIRFWSFLTRRDRVSLRFHDLDSPSCMCSPLEPWSSCPVGHSLAGCCSPHQSLLSSFACFTHSSSCLFPGPLGLRWLAY
uniref:Uncharacterized protein n=1 Tax=Equus asinus TaxID=9793 RepID=A0A8C4KX59_EQUAS